MHPFAFYPPALASAKRGFLPARSWSLGLPCGLPREHDARCVQTSFCHPLYSLRAPAPRGLSIGHRVFWTHANPRELAFSRRTLRFGVPYGLFTWGALSSPFRVSASTSHSAEPLTPLSPPRFIDGAFVRIESKGPPRPQSSRLREEATTQHDPRCLSSTSDGVRTFLTLPSADLTTLPP